MTRTRRPAPPTRSQRWVRAIKLIAQIYDEAPAAEREHLDEVLRAVRTGHRTRLQLRGRIRRLYDEEAGAHLDRMEDKPVEYLCNVIKSGLGLIQAVREELEDEPRRLTNRDLHDLALADLRIRQAQAVIRKRYGKQ